ncbi:hypothetical protein ACOSP7_032025 [Xanthoceras sorbifolium]
MAGVRRLYLEPRVWTILPWLFPRSYKWGLGVHCSPPSVITRDDLVDLVHTFRLPMGHKVLVSRASDRSTHMLSGYIAISSHHLAAELRFPLPRFPLNVLNLLELAPIRLIPNVYSRLLSLYLIFRRKSVGSLTDNIARHCFQMKKCHLNKKLLGKARHDEMYYLPAQPNDYWSLLRLNIKSNAGNTESLSATV